MLAACEAQLEKPGSEARLRHLQARFRAGSARANRRQSFRSARPVARDFLLSLARSSWSAPLSGC
jgi:hypothetical protein